MMPTPTTMTTKTTHDGQFIITQVLTQALLTLMCAPLDPAIEKKWKFLRFLAMMTFIAS